MSKVEAYTCDCCHIIQASEQMVGVSLSQDMFDAMRSFVLIMNPAKADAHYCLTCYEKYVLNPARASVNRHKDEAAYKDKLREFQYNLRKITVLRFNDKKR